MTTTSMDPAASSTRRRRRHRQRRARLALFEPSLGLPYTNACIDAIEAALERGDREAAIIEVLTTILQMTSEEIDQYRQSPVWPERLRAAHTIPRECRAEQSDAFESTSWTAGRPTLVMTGSATASDLAAIASAGVAAIEGAHLLVLEGHDHMAHRAAPQLVAEHLLTFFGQ